MQGSVPKRNREIALWEMEEPQSGPRKKSSRRRQGNVAIVDLYPDRERWEEGPARRGRASEPVRQSHMEEPVRQRRTIEPIGQDWAGEPARRRRASEPVRQSRMEEPVRRRRTIEPIGQDWAGEPARHRRPAEPVRHRRPAPPPEWERDVDLIGEDWQMPPRRRVRSGQYERRRKMKKRSAYLYRTIAFCSIALCLMFAYMAVDLVREYTREDTKRQKIPVAKVEVMEEERSEGITKPAIETSLLEINDFSRPGTPLNTINSVFVHYTANPGTSAAQNRSYFANLAETQERSASAHFIIGYEGEIIQCIPLEEQAYAVMTRNEDSISIECCYLEEDGEFTEETYDSLVHLLAWLKQKYNLADTDILRHYDCGGKKCPLYYVEHEEAWENLLIDVANFKAE